MTFNDKNFTNALYDSNSTEYKELEAEILMLVSQAINQSLFLLMCDRNQQAVYSVTFNEGMRFMNVNWK